MNSFTEFTKKIKEFPTQVLPGFNITLPAIRSALAESAMASKTPSSFSNDELRKFSEEVSSLVQNETFLSNFGDQIKEPLERESEDEFVKRTSNTLRRMLRDKLGVKN